MRVIIVESMVYRVSDKEYAKIKSMSTAAVKAKYPDCDRLGGELNEYLDKATKSYVKVGIVSFDWRR